jgi:uncharacterized protein (DUF924 family)
MLTSWHLKGLSNWDDWDAAFDKQLDQRFQDGAHALKKVALYLWDTKDWGSCICALHLATILPTVLHKHPSVEPLGTCRFC